MKIRRIAAIAWFFAKTIYLSPSNNPLVYLLLIIGGMLFFSGSLGKHETALLLLLAGITNRLMPTSQTRKNAEEISDESLSRYSFLWPVKKNEFFYGFQISGFAFALLLIIPCIYIGTHCETPPMIGSLCPPRTCIKYAPSGEPVMTVEEVIMLPDSALNIRPVQLTIPVYHSLLFGYLASEVLVAQDKISDSLFNELCLIPPQPVSPADIFDPTHERGSPSWHHSGFLASLSQVQNKRLLYFACFVLLFFIMDGIAKFGHEKSAPNHFIIRIVKYVFNAGYLSLCCLLIFDVLLPESIISRMSLMIRRLGGFPRVAFVIVFGAGMLWVLMSSMVVWLKTRHASGSLEVEKGKGRRS